MFNVHVIIADICDGWVRVLCVRGGRGQPLWGVWRSQVVIYNIHINIFNYNYWSMLQLLRAGVPEAGLAAAQAELLRLPRVQG